MSCYMLFWRLNVPFILKSGRWLINLCFILSFDILINSRKLTSKLRCVITFMIMLPLFQILIHVQANWFLMNSLTCLKDLNQNKMCETRYLQCFACNTVTHTSKPIAWTWLLPFVTYLRKLPRKNSCIEQYKRNKWKSYL